jgi:hypothetical protein
MRKLLTLLLSVVTFYPALAQRVAQERTAAGATYAKSDWGYQISLQERADEARSNPASTSTLPNRTYSTEAVTAIKIAESSNAFTFIADRDNQVSVTPEVGTNGGTLAFIYRQNVTNCGGAAAESGKYRYSISTTGGQSWNVGSGVTVTASAPAPNGHCYGLNVINPNYTLTSRYPNAAIFPDATVANPTIDDLNMVYVGPVLSASGQGWNGHVYGTATAIAGNPTVTQEAYIHQGGDQYLPGSLVNRPGTNEFFYIAQNGLDNDDRHDEINVNRGTWDPATKQVTWTATRIIPPHFKTSLYENGTEGYMAQPKIAFSPDGQHGWMAFTGDLIGGLDTSASPVFYRWTGGNNWAGPISIDLRQFPELVDSLTQFLGIDANGDTIPVGTGRPTVIGFDLVVDNAGNPHMFGMVANNSSNFATAGPSSPGPQFFYPGIVMMLYDITRDSYGDWNAIYVSPLLSFDALFGDLGNSDLSARINSGPSTEVSISTDGNVVFYSWTDSDTASSSYSTQIDPQNPTAGANTNTIPNLLGRAYDVTTNKLTPIVNHTLGDPNFESRAILPKPSMYGINSGNTYTQPMVLMDLPPGQSTLNPVSLVYFSNISYDRSTQFTINPTFFYNCKQNPFANTVVVTDAACGASDGAATVNAAGGLGSYTFEWDAAAGAATTASVTGLAAGIYNVTVTDEAGCSDVIAVVVNNANGPVSTIPQDSVADISCAGAGNGTAGIAVTGGTAPYTYLWGNGETTSRAVGLPAGTTTVAITDANGCKSFTQVTIDEPAEIVVETTKKDVKCNGETNGEATVAATGGTGALSYSWSNGATTANVTGLAAGTYTVTVTDASGCVETAQVDVAQPLALAITSNSSANVLPYTVGGTGTGTAVANVSGGSGAGTYTYAWTGPAGFTAGPSAQASFILLLWGGDYVVTVTDQNGCSATDTVTVGGAGPRPDNIEDLRSIGLSEFSVQPNPNNGVFSLKAVLSSPDVLTMEVMNVNGQVVERQSTGSVLETETQFNLERLPAGLYLIRVSTSKGSGTARVVIK